MKGTILTCLAVCSVGAVVAVDFTPESLAFDLRRCTAPDNYIWTSSGRGTCAPLGKTVCGVSGFYAPPYAAGDLSLFVNFTVDGHPVPDAGSRGKDDVGLLLSGSVWRPDCLARRGTYHFNTADAGLLSFGVETETSAFVSCVGFGERICLTNRTGKTLTVLLSAVLEPGHPRTVALGGLPLGQGWDYCPPKPGEAAPPDLEILLCGSAGEERVVEPGGVVEWNVGVLIGRKGVFDPDADVGALISESRQSWSRRLEDANMRLPRISSNVPGLESYYLRSVASGLVSIWDSPDFAVRPFVMTSGLDGGSLCCYPWDSAGYADLFLTLLLGDGAKRLLNALLDSGVDRHIAMSLDGTGQGWCSYSYSAWSMVNLYWTYCTVTGKGEELFERVLSVFENEERRLPGKGALKDYGVQHNLLEMRSCGWEHITASPNAERAWCFDRLADLGEEFGKGEVAVWRAKAEEIRRAIRTELWDGESGWFKSLHEDRAELVYSVQAYDALRLGACTAAMGDALCSHVREGAFLGRFGTSSISAEDRIHYELVDIDWSGNGSYSGEGPNLAETLWLFGRGALAWDVFSREFWMGEMLPYFPQEHYVDRPLAPEWARANVIAGVSGMQAVLKGMTGFRANLDGTLVVAPKPHPTGKVEVKGYRHRGRLVDVVFSADRMRVTVNGTIVYEGVVKEIVL